MTSADQKSTTVREGRYTADEAGDPVVAERTYLFEDESYDNP